MTGQLKTHPSCMVSIYYDCSPLEEGFIIVACFMTAKHANIGISMSNNPRQQSGSVVPLLQASHHIKPFSTNKLTCGMKSTIGFQRIIKDGGEKIIAETQWKMEKKKNASPIMLYNQPSGIFKIKNTLYKYSNCEGSSTELQFSWSDKI